MVLCRRNLSVCTLIRSSLHHSCVKTMAQIVSLSVPSVPAGVERKEEGLGGKREGTYYAGYYSF